MVVEWEVKRNKKLSRLAYTQTTRGKATANSVEIHFHLPKPASGNTGIMSPRQSRKDFSGQNTSQFPHGCGCDGKQKFEKYGVRCD